MRGKRAHFLMSVVTVTSPAWVAVISIFRDPTEVLTTQGQNSVPWVADIWEIVSLLHGLTCAQGLFYKTHPCPQRHRFKPLPGSPLPRLRSRCLGHVANPSAPKSPRQRGVVYNGVPRVGLQQDCTGQGSWNPRTAPGS